MEGPPSDEALLVGVAERDIGAFRALYERHAGWLALRLERRYNDRDLVADAVQDTFVAVWQKPQGAAGSSASPASRVCKTTVRLQAAQAA
jgi:DNA-directed RNA polymerase specialized sigma24 family protein